MNTDPEIAPLEDARTLQDALLWFNLRRNVRHRTAFTSVKRGAPRKESPIMEAIADTCLRRLGVTIP